MVSDGALLKDYAKTGSEGAFAELVRRHIDLVFSTALRVLGGNSPMAEDVAQLVFLDVAQKASALSDRPVLTGWLHSSAVFTAAKMVRSECRRQAREQKAHAMQANANSPTQEGNWKELRPILDEIMLEMKEADREALLLRFFQRCSLAEVGLKLRVSENAARMRVERALEKLRQLLEQRGITSTSSALSGVLAQHTLIAAPAALAVSITAATLAAAAASGAGATLGISIMSYAKSILVGAIVAGAVLTPMVLQYQANLRLKAENETLRSQAALALATQRSENGPVPAGEQSRGREEHSELLRLRGEVTSLRRQVEASASSATRSATNAHSQVQSVTDAEVAQFLQYPLVEQAKLLGNARGHGGASPEERARNRLLAEKVRPDLERLESRPSDFADFQSAFIKAAIDLQDEGKLAQVRSVIQSTYEKAVAEHLDGPSRPQDGVEDWGIRRDALDREATRRIQQLLSAEERRRFDRLFLGIMGIDLGIGDGAWHRFVTENGVIFPSEQPQPASRQ